MGSRSGTGDGRTPWSRKPITFTRIAARRLGSPFTYAALSEGDRAAPGMPTAAELRQVYGWGAIDGDTEVVGLPGPADPPRLAALNRPLREGRGVRLYLPLGVGAAQARAHEGELRALGITLDA